MGVNYEKEKIVLIIGEKITGSLLADWKLE